ncbi:MAG: SAC family polyphosphoinositide phosphatase [Crocinitomicaceae bacterium]|jgi:hypothetical protein|nr:SAC family polyphosphoinositide phosphatase [Crocinitomicaceae bacterium]
MKQSITFLCALCFIININAQVTVSTNDFKILDNTNWEGTLTYIDYQSGKPTDVATTMQVKVTEKTIEQNIQYVWEPDKNVIAITKIKRNGKFIGKQKVVSKIVKENGSMQIITKAEGKDDGKKATFYYTYVFDSENYSVTKEVQFPNSDERFMRNSYKYKILTDKK